MGPLSPFPAKKVERQNNAISPGVIYGSRQHLGGSMARPVNTLLSSPPGGITVHGNGRASVTTVITTVSNNVAGGSLQEWPSGAAIATITSSEGSDDAGRIIEYTAVNAEYEIIIDRATLGAAGTVAIGTFIDVCGLLDKTADPLSAEGDISAKVGAITTATMAQGTGRAQCSRYWIPPDHVGYLQSAHVYFEHELSAASLWVWEIDGTWCLAADALGGTGPNRGGDVPQVFASPTSWGIPIVGPARVEFRAISKNITANVVVEFVALLVPDEQQL